MACLLRSQVTCDVVPFFFPLSFPRNSGKVSLTGAFASLFDIGVGAFFSLPTEGVINAESTIAIRCVSPSGLNIATFAFYYFQGNHDDTGEQTACTTSTFTTTSTTTTTTTTSTTTTTTTTTTTSTTTSTTTTTTLKITANNSAVMLAAKSAVGMQNTYAVPCAAGEYWNVDAFGGRGGCYPCTPGTFVSTVDDRLLRVGDDSYTCQSSCAAGYTTLAGATSKAACIVAYSVRWASDDPESCSGSDNRATTPENTYHNVGYGYVTTQEECELAARLLSSAPLNESQGVVAERLSKPCLSANLDAEAAYAYGYSKDAEDANASDPAECTPSLSSPLGFCGIEHFDTPEEEENDQQQMLVFYPNDGNTGAEVLHRPAGATFVAICRIVFCNYLEMVKADGAVAKDWIASSGGPQPEDDAVCTPNPLQLNAWRAAEASAYRKFYAIAGATTGTVLIASWVHTCKGISGSSSRQHTGRRYIWLFLGSLSLAVRVWDWLTDWAFYGIAVTTPRLEYLMDDSGLVGDGWSYDSFKTASVVFCLVSTICLPFDLYGFYERTEAIIRRQRPPVRAVYLGLGILCIEDLPQFTLGIMYIDLISNDPGATVDTMAVLSVLMSLVGMTFTLLLFFKPGWFHETDKTVAAMPMLEIEHTIWGSSSSSSLRSTTTSSSGRSGMPASIADTLTARRQTLSQQRKGSRGGTAAVTVNPTYNVAGVASSAAAPDYASIYEPPLAAGTSTAGANADYAVPEQLKNSIGIERIAANSVYAGGMLAHNDGEGNAAETYGTTQTLRSRQAANVHNHVKMLPTALYATSSAINGDGGGGGYLDVAGANEAGRAAMQNATYGTRQVASAGHRPRSGSVYEVSNVVRDRFGTMQLAATQEGVLYNVPFGNDEEEEVSSA